MSRISPEVARKSQETRDEETRNFFETFNEHGTEIAGDRYTHSRTLRH